MDLVAADRFAGGESRPSRTASVLAPVRTVSTASRPRPGTAPADPRRHRGRRRCGRASGSRRTGPGPSRRGGRGPGCRCPSPPARSAARSAMVAFSRQEDEVGVAGSGWPGSQQRSSTAGSARSGSRSSKLAIRGRRGTAIVHGRPSAGGPVGRPSTSSSGRSRAAGHQVTVPSVRGRCARGSADGRCRRARVAAELVDDVARKQRPLLGLQQCHRADELGDDAAALDVADQDDRHAGARRRSPCWRCRPRAG